MSNKLPWWGWLFGFLALGSIISSCDEQNKSIEPTVQSTPSIEQQAPAKPINPSWQYNSFIDEMSSKSILMASIASINTVNFDFPYQGEQRAILRLRRHPRFGNDVMLIIERGQFNTKYDGTPVLVRFDNDEAIKFTALEPDDHSRTILFIQGFKRFMEKMKKASTIRIEAPFYNEGNRVFEFDVSNLNDKW